MKVIAVSGSLRKHSFNTRLSRLMEEVAPEGMSLEAATLHGIPLYDGDLEQDQGIPEDVEHLRERIKACDGLILVTPEYNAGMPGVFKNALDWLTRPPEEMKPTFGGRKTAIAGASPGGWGTAFAQAGSLINLRQLGCHLFPGYLRISKAGDAMPEDGEIEEKVRKQVAKWLEEFAEFVES